VGVPSPAVDLAPESDIGVRTFEQLNQSMSLITGVPTTNSAVRSTYLQVQQQLPPVPNIQAFLASHQTGIAQLAIKYCAALVDDNQKRAQFFPQLDVSAAAGSQFADDPGKNRLIGPLLVNVFQQKNGVDLASQPADAEVRAELSALITRLVAGGADSRTVAKAACAAALGSGALEIL
jgi:hypothetical protein